MDVLIEATMKKCSKCRKEKSELEFSKDKYKKTGLKSTCKICDANYQSSIPIDKKRSSSKLYEASLRRKLSRRKYFNSLAGKLSQKKSIEKYPEKRLALNVLNNAVNLGILIKPKVCSKCGLESNLIDGHHKDYSKPLDVMWICRQCHVNIHKNKTKIL